MRQRKETEADRSRISFRRGPQLMSGSIELKPDMNMSASSSAAVVRKATIPVGVESEGFKDGKGTGVSANCKRLRDVETHV